MRDARCGGLDKVERDQPGRDARSQREDINFDPHSMSETAKPRPTRAVLRFASLLCTALVERMTFRASNHSSERRNGLQNSKRRTEDSPRT